MRKTRLAQNKKDDLHNLGSDDLLSRLPDEILVSILCSLPLKDAAVTSLLSRRWRFLWCQTDCLVFEDSNATREKYMSWVNHIIDQHKSPTIHKFKISFGLDENANGAINKWIKFAISKDVRTLELNLTRNDRFWPNCFFPNEIFYRKCGSSLKRHSLDVSVMEIKFLKSLILNCVDVNDEGLKRILSNCPVLEHLSIARSSKLVKAEIHGKGLALKKLDILLCDGLESVEICDSNIVFFRYWGSPITLRLDNLQKLEKIGISILYSWKKINEMFYEVFSNIPYLQVLEVLLYRLKESIELLPFPKLQKIEQLIIKVDNWDVNALVVLPFLVEACPNLHKLTIMKISWSGAEKTNWEVRRQMVKKPHHRVEVVEIDNYCGGTSDFKLVMYFIQNFVALKKLVIKPFTKLGYAATEEEKNAVRNRAREELEPRTPDGVELVIL